jgi:hypothetical protein
MSKNFLLMQKYVSKITFTNFIFDIVNNFDFKNNVNTLDVNKYKQIYY